MKTTKFNTKDEARILWEIMVFDEFDSNEIVNWAIQSISNGYDSESLRILTGLDNSDTEERKVYFRKSLNELNIELKEVKFETLKEFAIYISKSVVNNQLNPITGLRKMLFICSESKYDEQYTIFYQINDDISLLSDGYSPNYIRDLSELNIREKLKLEFVKFLEMNDELNNPLTLSKKSDLQLIEIKYFDNKNYSKQSIKIVTDLLTERKLSEKQQLELKEIVRKKRRNEMLKEKQIKNRKKGILTWIFELLTN